MKTLALTGLRRILAVGFLVGSGSGWRMDQAQAQEGALPPPEPAVATPGSSSARPLLDSFADLTSFARDLPPTLFESARQRAEYHLTAATNHRAAGRWREALDATAQAIAADPGLKEAFQLQAEIYADKSLFAHAIATLDDCLAIHVQDPLLLGYRGSLKSRQHQAEAGRADIELALRSPGLDQGTRDWLRACEIINLGDRGDFRRCVAEYDRLGDKIDADAEKLRNRGAALLILGEFDRALSDFEAVAARESGPLAIYERGWARLRAGHFASALADFEQVYRSAPTDATVQVSYAVALFAANRRAEAIAHLDALLKEHPDEGLILTARGWAALLAGQCAQAHPLLEQAARQGVGRYACKVFASHTFVTDPEYDAILADFEARCRTWPTLPFSLYYRTGAEARTSLMPQPIFHVALVSRVLHASHLAPTVIAQVSAQYVDQPWRPAAHLGEVLASACLLDRARLVAAADHLLNFWAASRSSQHSNSL